MERFWPPHDRQLLSVENLDKLTVAAEEKGIALPKTFIAFMSDLELQKRMGRTLGGGVAVYFRFSHGI
jgi:hypothetical protein